MSGLDRRALLQGSAGVVLSTWLPRRGGAIGPIERSARAPWKLGLAGYSLRKYFQRPEGDAQRLDLHGFLDYCAEHQVDGAELTQYYFPESVTSVWLRELKRHAHLIGVEICGGAIRNNFTVAAGDELAEQLEHVRVWCRHYAELGAPVMRIFAGEPASAVPVEEAIDRVARALEVGCKAADEFGVVLALENHDFTTDVDRLLAIVERVDSQWLGINFDSGNFGRSADPYGAMARMAPYAVSAQLKVSIQSSQGEQQADWRRILGILHDAGYAGYITLEYEESEEPYEAIPRHLAELRALMRERA